jgi:lysophospholipase L1-like esterase
MSLLLRIVFIIILCICYKYIPVFEPKGINYLLSILCLGFIGFEFKKLWSSLSISERKKIKIHKIAYFSLIILILISVILTIHKEYPTSNLRYIRGIFILISIGIGVKIVGIISKSSINSIFKNSILITYSTISFIAVLETIFMFISLSHGGGEAYGGKIWNRRYWNPINNLGFRDKEPKNGKNTVFFVGDSFTAGWGLKKIEDRFGEVTASELNKQGKTINEINLGRYGADTRLEYHIFEKFIKKTNIKPDHIVLQFFVNDMDKFIQNTEKCITSSINIPTWKKTLTEGSYLANYIYNIYPSQTKNNLPKECDYIEKLKFAYNNDSMWNQEENQLKKFKDYCLKNNINMTLVFFPLMEDLTISKKIGIENRIINFCNKNNIRLFNVTNFIIKLSRSERQVSMVDAHASAEVHKIVGENLATIIKI